jgi:hypothetical protein
MTMQDAPIHCPADVEATDVERAACEATAKPPKPGKPIDGEVAPRSGGGGGSTPPKKPPVSEG